MAAGRKNFIFFLCLLDGVQFITTFRYDVSWLSIILKHEDG